MQRSKVLSFRPLSLGLLVSLSILAPSCAKTPVDEDTEGDEEDESEESDTTSDGKDTQESDASSSSTGSSDSSSTSTDTSTDSTSDTTTTDPGSQLGKCDRALTPTTTVNEDLSSSVTWNGVVKISGKIELRDGVTLTIEKGTTILAEAGASLVVGDAIYKSTLIAQGTKDEPVRFCGVNDSPGSWEGLVFGRDTQGATALSYVAIENAGEKDEAGLKLEKAVRLEHVEVSGSAGHGVWADTFGADSVGLRIEKCQVGARLDEPEAVQAFPKDSMVTGNLTNIVELGFDSIESNVTFRDLGAAYRQMRDLRIRDSAVVTLEAGVEYEVARRHEIQVGGFSGKAQLITQGTDTEKVEIRGAEANAGSWRGIRIRQESSAATSLTHTVIKHGGDGSRASLEIEQAIKIDHVSVEDAAEGVYLRRVGLAKDSTHLSVKNTKGYALRVRPEAIIGLPAGGTFEKNEHNSVWVESGDIEQSGTIVKMPVPYHIDNTVRLGRSVDLVIAPGTEFEMGKRADLDLDPHREGSSVIMKGTAAETIKFFGEEKTAGYWGSVRAGEDLKDTTVFEHVEFSHGGDGYKAGMLQLERPFPVLQCVFSNSEGYGIKRDRDDSTDYTQTSVFKDNKEGPVGN